MAFDYLQISNAADAAERAVYPETAERNEAQGRSVTSADDLLWLKVALEHLGLEVNL